MKRVLSFCIAFLTGILVQPAVAGSRPLKEATCAHVASIDNWRVRNPRKLMLDVRTQDTRGLFLVTLDRECFPRFPNNTLRVEARGECLAPGDSMFFTFPSSRSQPSDGETRCVVSMVQGTVPPQPERAQTCTWELGPDGKPPYTQRCY